MRQPGGATAREVCEYAGHIARAGRRLLEVVSDVLDMSKLESGSVALNKHPLLLDVLEVALKNTSMLFEAKQQPVAVRLEPDLPQVTGDSKRLIQLFGNLLSNASKFTEEGGRILILARVLNSGSVTVTIADTGVGMTHERIVVALKPFAQVQGHLARTQEGTGH